MPLMSLAATAIDQPKHRDAVIETMVHYLHTDPVCCRHEPGKLADLQHQVSQGQPAPWGSAVPVPGLVPVAGVVGVQVYGPIVEWARAELGVEVPVTDSIFGAQLSPEAVQGVREYLQGGWRRGMLGPAVPPHLATALPGGGLGDGLVLRCSVAATPRLPPAGMPRRGGSHPGSGAPGWPSPAGSGCVSAPASLLPQTAALPTACARQQRAALCCAGLDSWHLAAAEQLASCCKSVLIALAVLQVSRQGGKPVQPEQGCVPASHAGHPRA